MAASAAQCNQSLASIANLCGRGIAACSWSAILPTPMRKYYHQMLLRKGEEVHLLSLTLTSGRLSHSVTVRGLVERNGPELIGAGSAMRDSGGVALSPQRRRLSSHKWGNIDPATEKARMCVKNPAFVGSTCTASPTRRLHSSTVQSCFLGTTS